MHQSDRSLRASAFTLVELLIVVAVIGILVAMLFPAWRAEKSGSSADGADRLKSPGGCRFQSPAPREPVAATARPACTPRRRNSRRVDGDPGSGEEFVLMVFPGGHFGAADASNVRLPRGSALGEHRP